MTANATCTFTGTLTSTTPGSYSISPGVPVASGSSPGSGGPAATLTVNPLFPPTATIVVAPTSIAAGGQALATITLTNPNSVPLNGVGDSVTPPSGTSFVANLQSGTCNGTQSVGAGAFTLSNATLAANASCTIASLITSSTAGTYPVSSGTTSATGANVSASGPTTPLIVKSILAPIVTVSLSPTSIPSGGQSLATVTFKKIQIPLPSRVSAIRVIRPFSPAFVASVTGGTCNGTSSVTANSFQLSGATLAANASCTISYPVTSTTVGTFAISTGTPTIGATYGVQGAPAYLNVMIAQTITFQSSAPASNMVGGFYTPVVSASSGLPVTTTIDTQSSGICSIASGVVTFNAPGNCILDANQAGNSTFTPASQVQQLMNVQGPPIEVTIYDQSYFVAYGKNAADYTVTRREPRGKQRATASSSPTLVSAGLDGAAAQWSCIAAVGGGGLSCRPAGTGLLSATVNLPAGSGLEWQWVVPVNYAGTVQTVTAAVSATGALTEQDVNTLVLFRDGLD